LLLLLLFHHHLFLQIKSASPDIKKKWSASASFQRNIFVSSAVRPDDKADSLFSDAASARGGKNPYALSHFDLNVYWIDPGSSSSRSSSRADKSATALFPVGQNFSSWQRNGAASTKAPQDSHSAVGDPLFVDAAALDFRLKDASPALARGFQPIPTADIGPRKAGQQKESRDLA
jgi:hypothetical protein